MPNFFNTLDQSTVKTFTDLDATELKNLWVNFGGSWSKAGYVKVQGVVFLKGLIRDGIVALNTLIFTLPVGYRPGEDKVLDVPTWDGTSLTFGRIDILANGRVNAGNQENKLRTSWVSLDNISFLAEQ